MPCICNSRTKSSCLKLDSTPSLYFYTSTAVAIALALLDRLYARTLPPLLVGSVRLQTTVAKQSTAGSASIQYDNLSVGCIAAT